MGEQLSFMYTVTIPRDEYEELLASAGWLDALEAAGVDNWDGIDFAREILETFPVVPAMTENVIPGHD